MSTPYSEYTPIKNKRYYEIIRQNIITVKKIIEKHFYFKDKKYYHFDLYAGSGRDKEGNDGSVLQFIKLAEKYKMNYHLICIEKDRLTYRKLVKNIRKYDRNYGYNGEIDYHNNDNNEINLVLNGSDNSKKYGSIYADPRGIPSFELLRKMAKIYKKMDIIINLSTTTIKRQIQAGNLKYNLIEELKRIEKDKWFIQEPPTKLKGHAKAFYWVFLIGTNWMDMKKSKKLGFYNINSKRGKQILYQMTYTKDEKDLMKSLNLFKFDNKLF